MTHWPEHITGVTTHARRGGPVNAFRYGVDYVLVDPEAGDGPALFSRNRFNLAAVHDRDHGGVPKAGRGLAWAEEVFAQRGVLGVKILLLTQPTCMGYLFNPVSFWLAMQGQDLIAVIAEVNNTYGDRHSYFCARPNLEPIQVQDQIHVRKVFHVSPYQDVAGDYAFNFDIRPDRIAIRIGFRNASKGLIATLRGPRLPMTNRALLWGTLIRRPTGALRTSTLIYWQALKLKLKGAAFRRRPTPPGQEVT